MSLLSAILSWFRRAPVVSRGQEGRDTQPPLPVVRETQHVSNPYTLPGPVKETAPSFTQASEADLLRAAMTRAGITDPETRAGIAAICMGESALRPRSEASYRSTDNARIRRVFRARVADLNDAQLNELKGDDRRFFNWVYGMHFQSIHHLGNTDPGDGYKFRGRGLIQLTGRANYARYSEKIGRGRELLDNPDLANEPAVAAELTVAYIKDRYEAGMPLDFDALCKCVGNNTPDIKARKDRYYAQFRASGEFAA